MKLFGIFGKKPELESSTKETVKAAPFPAPQNENEKKPQPMTGKKEASKPTIIIAEKNYDDRATRIIIPNDVLDLGNGNPFFNYYDLSQIIVSPDHPSYAVIDGILYEKKTRKLICCPRHHIMTECRIPNGITSIGDSAFACCSGIYSVIIPDSVSSIGKKAFDACNNLNRIELGNGVQFIDDGVFHYTSLKSITLPNSVCKLGFHPFTGNNSLTEIVTASDHPYYKTENGVLYEKATNKLVFYPCALTAQKFQIPEGIKAIGDYAFYTNKHLTAITLPDSIESIGVCAFNSCKSLTSISIPARVNDIGGNAFSSFSPLTITVVHGSYAEQYCEQNNLSYTYNGANNWLLG